MNGTPGVSGKDGSKRLPASGNRSEWDFLRGFGEPRRLTRFVVSGLLPTVVFDLGFDRDSADGEERDGRNGAGKALFEEEDRDAGGEGVEVNNDGENPNEGEEGEEGE